MIIKDPMNYKTYLQNNEIMTIRLRIIKHRIVDKLKVNEIANRYSMHRNSVLNIIKLYKTKASIELKHIIENNISINSSDIYKYCDFLLHKSRKPKTNIRQATLEEEQNIINYFNLLKVGPKRLYQILKIKEELNGLTFAKIKGVYKRNGLKIQKVKTRNGETRALYNYETIGAFTHGHFDTKEIADARSLPPHIYNNLKHNTHLSIYEWNIIFVGCRARFTAYSRGKTSTFGLQFLVLVLSHLRYCGVYDHINIHTDGGSEFFSGSKNKQQHWNNILKELDCVIDCYNPNWDIRKNLIERSHRSDDEEFLIPFGDTMKTLDDFMFRAQNYQHYRNNSRIHSGKGMNKTPREKLLSYGFSERQVDRILDFKVLYLDSYFYDLQEHLNYFIFQSLLRSTSLEKLKTDRKYSILQNILI